MKTIEGFNQQDQPIVNDACQFYASALSLKDYIVKRTFSEKTNIGFTKGFALDSKRVNVSTGLPIEKTLETLAHEFVHMFQLEKNRLEVINDNFLWNGKAFKEARTREEYQNFPWEKEAREKGKELFNLWQKSTKFFI